MNRLKLLIVVLFAVALGTGILVGMGVSKSPAKHDRGSWLAEELNLTPSQNEDMKKIWSDVNAPGRNSYEQRRGLQKDRDDAIYALLTDSQKASYDKITEKYNDEVAELNHERDQSFQAAVEATKQILNDAQRAKYDELIKRGFRGVGGGRDGGRGGPGGGPGGPWRGPSTRHGGFSGSGESGHGTPAGTLPAVRTGHGVGGVKD